MATMHRECLPHPDIMKSLKLNSRMLSLYRTYDYECCIAGNVLISGCYVMHLGKETRTTAKCGGKYASSFYFSSAINNLYYISTGVAFGARLSTIVLLLALQILFW